MRLWCKRKRWGFSFTSQHLYLYLYLLYKAPVNKLWKWKEWKRDAGKGETPPVWGVCTCLFLGVSWVSHVDVRVCSHSGNIQLLVPWVPGHLCKVSEYLTALSCIIFGLAPVNHHWWACFFWPVAGTNVSGCTEVSLIMHLCFSDCLLSFSFIVWVRMTLVGCIYAPYKVNPNIFQFYFDFWTFSITHASTLLQHLWILFYFLWFYFIFYYLQ